MLGQAYGCPHSGGSTVSDAFVPLEQPLSWSLEPWCSQSDSSSKLWGPGWPAMVVSPGLWVQVPVSPLWTWGLEYGHSQSNSGSEVQDTGESTT